MLWDDGRFRMKSIVPLDKYRVQSSSSSQANEASAVERPGSEQKAADFADYRPQATMGRAFINFKWISLTHQQIMKECSQVLFPRACRQFLLDLRYQVTTSIGTQFLAIVNVATRIQNLYLHFHPNHQDHDRQQQNLYFFAGSLLSRQQVTEISGIMKHKS